MAKVVPGHGNLNGFTARERVVRAYGEELAQGEWKIIGTEVYCKTKRTALRVAATLNRSNAMAAKLTEERRGREADAKALVEYFDVTKAASVCDWLLKGAVRFDRSREVTPLGTAREIPTTDRLALALSLLDYFNPDESEAYLARRQRDGYTVTTDPATIYRIILRAHS